MPPTSEAFSLASDALSLTIPPTSEALSLMMPPTSEAFSLASDALSLTIPPISEALSLTILPNKGQYVSLFNTKYKEPWAGTNGRVTKGERWHLTRNVQNTATYVESANFIKHYWRTTASPPITSQLPTELLPNSPSSSMPVINSSAGVHDPIHRLI